MKLSLGLEFSLSHTRWVIPVEPDMPPRTKSRSASKTTKSARSSKSERSTQSTRTKKGSGKRSSPPPNLSPTTSLLLIESPGKVEKLTHYCRELGLDMVVRATYGHFRELQSRGDDDRGFDIEGKAITPYWETIRGKSANLTQIKQMAKGRRVYLATDGDREGEAISWHLSEVLDLDAPQRVVYTEVTKEGLARAFAHARPLNRNLVGAALARACLDRQVGYAGSKRLVWALDIGAKSMGRVQSSGLWLLAQRQLAHDQFQQQAYFTLTAHYGEGFSAAFERINLDKETPHKGKEEKEGEEGQISSKDDAGDGNEVAPSSRIANQQVADQLKAIALAHPHSVSAIDSSTRSVNPPPALTTSSLQQAASSRLKLSPDKTMSLAQSLYEKGCITYMRTDSTALSDTFKQAVSKWLLHHDPDRFASTKGNKGNETSAHEAIRPVDVATTPRSVGLSGDELKLYTLIWARAIAACCPPAKVATQKLTIHSGPLVWVSSAQRIEQEGYTRYWNNLDNSALPAVQLGQNLALKDVQLDQRQTQPPPLFTEAGFVKELERHGIGRPSTYATIVKTLKDRKYVELKGNKLNVTPMGMELIELLDVLLPGIVRPQFTAEVERALDAIAEGKVGWEEWLSTWVDGAFLPALNRAESQMAQTKRARKAQQLKGGQ